MDSDPDLNPNKTIWIYLSSSNLGDDEESPLSDNFLLFHFQRSNFAPKPIKQEKDGSYAIRGKLSNIIITLADKCSDSNCTIRPEDKKDLYNYEIYWEVPTLTHQNPSFPVDEIKHYFVL